MQNDMGSKDERNVDEDMKEDRKEERRDTKGRGEEDGRRKRQRE